MTHIYIFSNTPSVPEYLGAYVNQLIEKDIKITKIEFKERNELTDRERIIPDTYCNEIRKIVFPKKEEESELSWERYYRNIFYAFVLYISNEEKNIFYFNDYNDLLLLSMIREKCMESTIFLTIPDKKLNLRENKKFLLQTDKVICFSDLIRRQLILESDLSESKIKLIPSKFVDICNWKKFLSNLTYQYASKANDFTHGKIKILFCIDSLAGGGAEKLLINILKAFDYEKYEIDLIVLFNYGVYFPGDSS